MGLSIWHKAQDSGLFIGLSVAAIMISLDLQLSRADAGVFPASEWKTWLEPAQCLNNESNIAELYLLRDRKEKSWCEDTRHLDSFAQDTNLNNVKDTRLLN
jgi:hypothetical protein